MSSRFIDDEAVHSGDETDGGGSSEESAERRSRSSADDDDDVDAFFRADGDDEESDLRTSESGISENEREERREKRRRVEERAEEAARILNRDDGDERRFPPRFQHIIDAARPYVSSNKRARGADCITSEEGDASAAQSVGAPPEAALDAREAAAAPVPEAALEPAPAAEHAPAAEPAPARDEGGGADSDFIIRSGYGTSMRVTKDTPLPIKKESYQGGNRRQTKFDDEGVFPSFRLPDDLGADEDPRHVLINVEVELESLRETNGFPEGFSQLSNAPFFDGWLRHVCSNSWSQFVALDQASKNEKLDQIHANCYEVYHSLRVLAWRCVRAKEIDASLKSEAENMFTTIGNTYVIFRQLVEAFFIQWAAYEMDGVYHEACPRMIRVPLSLLDDLKIQEGEDPAKNDLLECKDKLRELAKMLRMRRVDKQIFEPVYVSTGGEGGGANSFAWAYKLWGSVDDWVVHAVKRHYGREVFVAFEGKKGNANEIKAYFRERDGLIQLQFTRHMMSFRNGVYFPNRDLFILHTDMTEEQLVAPHVYSCTYVDCDFSPHWSCRNVDLPLPAVADDMDDYVLNRPDPERRETAWDIPTPAFQKIMDDQGWSYEVQVSMYIMFGRLLYDQDYFDSEQLALFCWGRKETGKCYARGTEVMLADGRFAEVQNLSVGDKLMGDDGSERTIQSLARGREAMARITLSHGASFVCNMSHVLSLKSRVKMVGIQNERGEFISLQLESADRFEWTDDTVDISVRDYLRLPTKVKHHLKAYCFQKSAREGFKVEVLPEDDYFGFMLDGNRRHLVTRSLVVSHNSTLCNVAMRIYPSHLIGSCSTRQEATFGLQGYLNKYVIIQPEVTRSWRMEQSDFLKMIAGDIVAVQKKYQIPEDVEWRSPLIMAGNEVPGWADDHSAIARRLLIFYYSKGIIRDANMENRLKREIANIIVKCNRYYRAAAFMFQRSSIPWPAYFKEKRREFLKETSPIYEYLCSSDLVSAEGYSMPFEVLIQHFRAFHKNRAERKQLNTSLAVWRVAIEEWGARITEDPERRMYNGVSVRDYFVVGADLKKNVPIGFAAGTDGGVAAGGSGAPGGFGGF